MVTPALARRAWRDAEPVHTMIYFVPEARAAYERCGVSDPSMAYFGSRAAALGRVPAEVVIACFYNFNPDLVRHAIPAAWDIAAPEALQAARIEAPDGALRRGLDGLLDSAGLAEAAELARRAAVAACDRPQGRPLFAAHAALPWPDAPHLVLWHAQTLLREFRGDGHIAALVTAGISGLESIVLHVATGAVDGRFLRITRGWSREQWAAAAEGLRQRGLMTAGDELSEEGRRVREELEATTDRLAEPAYRVLGEAGCLRLAELTRPLSRTVVKAGMLNPAGLTDAASEHAHAE
jgi:hypothetical protein